MSSDHEAVRDSKTFDVIQDYAITIAQDLGLTLEGPPFRASTILPAMGPRPYKLVLSVTEPFQALVPFCFTREEVLGYLTGETTIAIQDKIRNDLEIRFRDDL